MGIDASPPNALGTFISQIHGAQDLSAGGLVLFRINNLHTLSVISNALRASPQFRRIGPGLAPLIGNNGIPPQDTLVRFVLITSMRDVEQIQVGFNLIP